VNRLSSLLMNYRVASLSMVFVIAASASSAAPVIAQGATVRAQNLIALERPEEVVSMPWATVTAKIAGASADRVRLLDSEGRELLSQVVDNDGDGKPDEFLFLASFGSKESRTFRIEPSAPAKMSPRVFARHDEPRDDLAWESDRGAWRIYGEGLKKTSSAMSSSGIDMWAKKTRELIVEKWYTKGHDEYHIDKGEGADFFDVGETLGAGGTAVWKNDTIFRADNFKAWKIIANGPLRAVFELRYDPWNAAGLSVSEIKRISIDAGQRFYRQESVFSTPAGGTIPYAIGLVKRPGLIGSTSRQASWAWVSGWGPTAPKNGGHGEIGTAVLLPRERVSDWKEVHGHYLAVASAPSGKPVVHYIGSAWTAAGEITSPQQWWRYLDGMAQRLESPIRTSWAP
jgi:pectinesterase